MSTTPADVYAELQDVKRRLATLNRSALDEVQSIATSIEGIVPLISSDDEIPADVYYAHVGSNSFPAWMTNGGSGTVNWDATDGRLYQNYPNAAAWAGGTKRFAWPNGPYGEALSFDPKAADVSVFVMEFRARFNANADYTTTGIGLLNVVAGAYNSFDTATEHFIQVLRNAGSWELGTCDGSTISQSSGGTGDGNFHYFKIEWRTASVVLYVDGVATITKTTNLPAQPLAVLMAGSAAGTFDVVGVSCTWQS